MDAYTARKGSGIAYQRDGGTPVLFGEVQDVTFSGIVWVAMTANGDGTYRLSETVFTPWAEATARIAVIA
jgi:hypothetical protein